MADSVRVLDDAIASLGGNDEALVRSIDTVVVAVTTLDADLAAANQARIRTARRRADAALAPSREVLALAGHIAVMANEPAGVAAELARRSLHTEPQPLPGPVILPWHSLLQAEATLLWSERHDEVLPVLDAAIRDARNAGDVLLLAGSLAYRAWAALHRGDLRGAEADARMALETAGMPVPGLFRVLNTALAVEAITEQDRLDDAEHLLAAEADLVEGTVAADACPRRPVVRGRGHSPHRLRIDPAGRRRTPARLRPADRRRRENTR